jgi:catechol 2,3-dioxygenase-like lactoylglutathione lyase family enzyme
MQLIDHASITVRDLQSAKPFYKAIMASLGAIVAYERDDAIGFGERNRPHDDVHTYISVFQSPHATPGPRRHWCFRAQSVKQVLAFHKAGLQSGATDEGAPGIRKYHPNYFAVFLLDPEGDKIEAVFHHARAGPLL